MIITNDINKLSPKPSETICCDEWGSGHFRDYTLTFVSKGTFRAKTMLRAGEVLLKVRMGSKRHEFWRSLSGMLHYQYKREDM